MKNTLLVAMLGVLLSACASSQRYEGPKREATEIAVIEKAIGKWSGYDVISINGKLNGLFGKVKQFEVLPGETTMSLSYLPGNNYQYSANIKFLAEAGKGYWLKTELSKTGYPGRWHVWVEDKESGKIISQMYRR